MENPGLPSWVKTVAAMPAEKQIEAVSKKLMELNPGFDGKLFGIEMRNGSFVGSPKVENGVVTELSVPTDHVMDISPVRALARLKVLACQGSGRVTSSGIFSPLRGMSLTTLHCMYTSVSDLSPLEGMPLEILNAGVTSVFNLGPLKGMPLVDLNLQHHASRGSFAFARAETRNPAVLRNAGHRTFPAGRDAAHVALLQRHSHFGPLGIGEHALGHSLVPAHAGYRYVAATELHEAAEVARYERSNPRSRHRGPAKSRSRMQDRTVRSEDTGARASARYRKRGGKGQARLPRPRLPAMGQSHASPACRAADRSRQQEADGVESGV